MISCIYVKFAPVLSTLFVLGFLLGTSLSACQIQAPLVGDLSSDAGQPAEGEVMILAGDDGSDVEVGDAVVAGTTGGDEIAGLDEVSGDESEGGLDGVLGGEDVVDMQMADMFMDDMSSAGVEITGGELAIDMSIAGEETLRIGEGDTMPLTCVGTYCPAARISAMVIPENVQVAEMVGCQVEGTNRGTSLSTLLTLFSDVSLNDFVQPDASGEVSLIILNHLLGWLEGQTGNEAEEVASHFYIGRQGEAESFLIDAASLDSAGAPLITFPDTRITDTLYQTPRADFTFAIPLAGASLNLRLSYSDISGFVQVDDVGFQMTEGLINGYLTQETAVSIMSELSASCDRPEAPDLCSLIGGLLTGDAEDDASILISILGGHDTLITPDGQPTACAGNPECNAISVCLQIEMSSVQITEGAD